MKGIKEIGATLVEIDVIWLREFGRFLSDLDLGSDEYHKNLAFLTFELACVTSHQNKNTREQEEILTKEILRIVSSLKDNDDYLRLHHILERHLEENLARVLYNQVSRA